MVDSSSFNLQPNFPIAGVADLYANRATKEAAIRAQQQKQLVEGLQAFGTGVDSLVTRRLEMAKALTAKNQANAMANIYAGTPEGQQVLGTNQVTTSPMGSPVTANQTANFDPGTGTVTPNQSKTGLSDIATAMQGIAPNDFFKTLRENKQLSYEPQKVANEAQRVQAEIENNKILRAIQMKLSGVTEEHTKNEDIASLLGKRTDEEKNISSGLASIFETDKSKQARKNVADINALLAKKGFTSAGNLTPSEQTELLALDKRFGGKK